MIPDKPPRENVFHGSEEMKEAHVPSFDKYRELYMKSVDNPDEFWGDVAKDFFWKTKHTGQFLDYNFDVTKGEIYIKCMEGASTNICYNLLDRNVHEKKLADKVAFFWEGNDPGDELTVTYRELLQRVCQFANVLKAQGVKKGDRVSIYMPMVVELVVAMLACVRIGAVHSIVFAGFSAESLCERIVDSQCCLLITAGQPHLHNAPATRSLQISINLQVAVLSLTLTSDLLWLDNKLLVGCKKGEMAELTGERDPDQRNVAELEKLLTPIIPSLLISVFTQRWRRDARRVRVERLCCSFIRPDDLIPNVGFPVGRCIMLKHLSKEPEGILGSQSPPAKRPCPDLQEKQAGRVKKTRPVPKVPWNPEVDLCWHALLRGVSDECEPEWCDSEDPLFILYTSGSTGKPKGVLHTVSGYMLYTATTFKLVFDHQPDDVYWCTADIGWITGHSYITYGPLANGATSVLFEGLPTYPDVSRMWEIVDKYNVTKFYTAPTAIRLLMKSGNEPVQRYKRSSLKVLGTVGEPINPEAWQWYYNVVGEKRCPIVDTFWQTETGGHVLTPLPAATPMKPGSATLPFFGVVPAILNESGEELEGPSEGYLVFKQPWPGVMRTVYGNHERFESTYFKKFPGYYVTGDGCRRDKDGYFWVTGRIDDMLNVSGHLLSTAEVESSLVEHEAVAEAAVVGRPHPVKGESLYCFVTLKDGVMYNSELEAELKKQGG
ncbi:acetyl-coenzyme A synthetase, cytoplasmic-like [Neolamprologus brichardi]|uniref:acetyl-coenzyme A synthetase, cytoplasmic-like n=1 Tax=Neolamprologus brichardi TaxID=32507 RepID=UPI001643D9C7|nr:acetyl-coenzyme A synthetase, cytoplasmic-like [Neolamprologus brichardi]